MDYCQFYHISERPEKECQVFNDKFINKDKKTLCDLGTAAISLGLNHLLDMTLEELDRQTIGLNSKQVSKVLLKDVERLEDVRPIDDLLQYINAKDGDTKEEDTTRKKKKKKNRRKKLEKEKEKDGEELEYNQENYFDDFDPLIMESIDRFGLKIRRKHVTCGISCGFGFPAKTFVGNCFLRFMESAGNFPAEFSAKNENKSTANFPVKNPQVIPQ
ncbi:SKP1 protein [Trifolium repens]|nr:SKP1 protein [Trifolium repens]